MNALLQEILKEKIIVIVRGVYGEKLLALSKALYAGGLRFLEVTFDQKDENCTPKTAQAVEMLRCAHGGKMHFGAGTVLSEAQAEAAAQAGAEFLISPNTDPAIIRKTKELGLLSIPGAMTPTEILTAHACGADLVKLFPAAALGMGYIKDIMAPLGHIRLLATAGVTEENFAQFLRLGMVGAGIGGRLTDKKLIAEENWAELTRRAEEFCRIAREN